MSMGFVVRGKKRDIIILADTLQDAEKELKKHKKDIEKFAEDIKESPPTTRKTKPKKTSVTSLIRQLKSEGYLDTPRNLKDIQSKLATKTYHYPVTSLTDPIKRLIRSGEIGRVKKNNTWHYAKR